MSRLQLIVFMPFAVAWAACAVESDQSIDEGPARSLVLSDLDVTEGALAPTVDGFGVNESKMRAVTKAPGGSLGELDFTYRGPSSSFQPLSSGADRRQLGLKLRAEDGCNVLYIMWHIEPAQLLDISVKSNPTEHTDDECGVTGYREIKPLVSAPIPLLAPGDSHALRAWITSPTAAAGSIGSIFKPVVTSYTSGKKVSRRAGGWELLGGTIDPFFSLRLAGRLLARDRPMVHPGDLGDDVSAVDLPGDTLTVSIDGKIVWEGALGRGVPSGGHLGVRSDNVAFNFQLIAGGVGEQPPSAGN